MIYAFTSNLTVENAYEVKNSLYDLLQHNDELVLDFKNITLIDSTGLGVLVSVHKKSKREKKTVVLTNVQSNIKDIFKITMLDSIFKIR